MALAADADQTPFDQLRLAWTGAEWTLSLGDQPAFHRTALPIAGLRHIPLADGTWVAVWSEAGTPYYAISLDGRNVQAVRATSYDLLLRYARFDPLTSAPPVPDQLAADAGGTLHIVQFVTQPLEAYRAAVVAAGGTVHQFLGNHAYLAQMSPQARAAVAALPFVRWVGPFHVAYKLEDEILAGLNDESLRPLHGYSVQMVAPLFTNALRVADRIAAVGGSVTLLNDDGFRLEALLTPEQLVAVAGMDEVLFIDRVLPITTYLDKVRIVGGANALEAVAGFRGTGVRAEVMDSGLLTTHAGFQHHPPIVRSNGTSTSHGTSVFGIVFGDGTGNPLGRGLLPDGQGIFALYTFTNRRGHLQGLTSAPFYGVFQTNSWGSCCTTAYGTYSAEIDDIIFGNDVVFLQAQANQGTQSSDVSAWGKNIVSVGGIRHYDTADLSDDRHLGTSGSTGPAIDGRIKPDLSFWYDYILTTANTGGYTTSFGGTSAATPTVAGHFGLFFQMWAAGIFGNPVDPGGTVFSNRPKSTTAKAVLINNARAYPFSGETADLRRVRQGWGLADVQRIYNQRGTMFVVNETDVLTNLQSRSYSLTVPAGTAEFRATLVYMDPAGVPNSQRHRINDLTLKVTAPGGTFYWGNNGLLAGNVSTSGGNPNTVDTVENVWVTNPAAGVWTVEVRADELVQDARPETPGVIDADYALVVTGVRVPRKGDLNCDGAVNAFDIDAFVLALTNPAGYQAAYPTCDRMLGDINCDGAMNAFDIDAFVICVSQGACPSCP